MEHRVLAHFYYGLEVRQGSITAKDTLETTYGMPSEPMPRDSNQNSSTSLYNLGGRSPRLSSGEWKTGSFSFSLETGEKAQRHLLTFS